MKLTYENAAKEITLKDAIWLYKRLGICTVINDGRDVTFELETVSTSKEGVRRN